MFSSSIHKMRAGSLVSCKYNLRFLHKVLDNSQFMYMKAYFLRKGVPHFTQPDRGGTHLEENDLYTKVMEVCIL